MSRFIIGLFLVFLFTACKDTVPKNVLSPKEMQAVLNDVFRADELANIYNNKDSLYKKTDKRSELYQTVFKIHHISKEQFRESFQFYQSRPDLLKPILDSLQSQNNRLTKTDSLKRFSQGPQ